jgi:predicted RNA methylase
MDLKSHILIYAKRLGANTMMIDEEQIPKVRAICELYDVEYEVLPKQVKTTFDRTLPPRSSPIFSSIVAKKYKVKVPVKIKGFKDKFPRVI